MRARLVFPDCPAPSKTERMPDSAVGQLGVPINAKYGTSVGLRARGCWRSPAVSCVEQRQRQVIVIVIRGADEADAAPIAI